MEEPNLAAYWQVIRKRNRFIIGFTILIVALTGIVSLAMPKTYESKATIKLGTIGKIVQVDSRTGMVMDLKKLTTTVAGKPDSILAFEPEEARELVLSAVVLTPVIREFYAKMTLDEFLEEVIEAEIATEKISVKEIRITPYIRIRVRENNAEKSKSIADAVVAGFLNYTFKRFSNQKNLIYSDYEQLKKATLSEIKEKEADIAGLEKAAGALRGAAVSEQAAVIKDYDDQIMEERDSLQDMRRRLVEIEINFNRRLADTEDFKVVSEPQLPLKPSSPDIVLNLAVALILGIAASVLLALFRESLGSKPERN